MARSVLSELDLDVVLERVLEAAQELTEARYAALGVLNDSKTQLGRFLTRGIDEAAHAAIGTLPSGRGVLGTLIEDPKPLRLADVGHHRHSYGFPPGHPAMRSFLGVPLIVKGAPYGNLYLTEKQGGAQFSEADEEAVVALAEFAGVAIDHASRYTGARERRDELERTVATLEATVQIARALAGETNLEVILELVAKRGRALVDARALLIELRRGNQLLVAAGAGELPDSVVGKRLGVEESVASHAMRLRAIQRLEDQFSRARFEEHGAGQLGLEAKSGIVVPLIFQGKAHGVLIAIDRLREGPSFSRDDERLLEAFAASAATAVATAETVASERQRQRLLAAEGERQRWARELHDETLQSLSALRIGLSSAARSGQPQKLTAAVGQAVDHLEEAIGNLRALITDLRPAALDELGVQAALEGLAERTSRHGMAVEVSVEFAERPDGSTARHISELETAVYRIAQEALTNALKHGQASRAVIELREDPTTVHMRVRDDGNGFDPHRETSGFGLLGMRERVELLGGELHLDSAPGRGTTVSASIPAQRRGREPAQEQPTRKAVGH